MCLVLELPFRQGAGAFTCILQGADAAHGKNTRMLPLLPPLPPPLPPPLLLLLLLPPCIPRAVC
jgi:hypothetical protein